VPRVAEARVARAACVAAALLVAFTAHAQSPSAPPSQTRTLYRWMDDQGRVQYSDRAPVGFKGEVTKVEVDLDTNTRPLSPPAPPPRQAIPAEMLRDVTPDIAKQRRDKRAKLDQEVRTAEKKVAAAKSALEAGADPKDDERSVIQRRFDRPDPAKSNCRIVPGADGRSAIVCPALIPNEQYYERIKVLEDALRQAEDELAQAQQAYRRGVD
jgi:hypothetical protein